MRRQSGFTLVEAITAIAVFAVVVGGVLGLFSLMARATKASREQTVLSALSASRLEIMRNLPYDEVGTASGNPNGTLPDFTAPDTLAYEGTDYQIYYEVTYLDDPADGTILAGTDPAPNDYKQVKMYIENQATGKVTSFLSNVSPKGLEGISNAGALQIRVFDANGVAVPGATVTITNTIVVPNINLSRTADSAGNWVEVGLPASVNGYHITATKSGFSTDQTHPITVANPNPVKPDATVSNGAVTSISFAIDLVADLTIRTLDAACAGLGGVDVDVRGSKLIGASPDVYKFDQTLASAGGAIDLSNIEWDVFFPSLAAGEPYTLYGTSPIQQVSVLPGANQVFTLILGPPTAHSLHVVVKNASTGAAIEGARVLLERSSSGYSEERFTGGSVWSQVNWSGGAGQADFTSPNRYFADDGNVDNGGPGVVLAALAGNYVPAGQLESSTFDTGGSSNYTTLEWEPTSQSPGTALRFQVATNNDNLTWNYTGPDGTAATYYTVPGTTMHASNNGNRYIRYRALLTSSDSAFTPTLSNVNANYVSGCNTPGQVIFTGLTAANNYTILVSMAGYSDFTASALNVNGNQTLEVLMSP